MGYLPCYGMTDWLVATGEQAAAAGGLLRGVRRRKPSPEHAVLACGLPGRASAHSRVLPTSLMLELLECCLDNMREGLQPTSQ